MPFTVCTLSPFILLILVIFTSASAFEVIELVPSVWVCETYVVHYLNGTELHCAPLTCDVHHGDVTEDIL